jgi:hypothetical protein
MRECIAAGLSDRPFVRLGRQKDFDGATGKITGVNANMVNLLSRVTFQLQKLSLDHFLGVLYRVLLE